MAIGESIVKRSNRTSLSLAIHFILSPLQTFISDSQGTSSSNFTYRLPSIPINPLMIHTGRLEPSLVVCPSDPSWQLSLLSFQDGVNIPTI